MTQASLSAQIGVVLGCLSMIKGSTGFQGMDGAKMVTTYCSNNVDEDKSLLLLF